MRQTLSSLLLSSQNYSVDPSSTTSTALSDTKTFLTAEINNVTRLIYNKLAFYVAQREQASVTVASQQYYSVPPDLASIESITVEIGSVKYPLQTVDSQESWNNLNELTYSGSIIPQFYFNRGSDFGIWPIPSTADYPITLNYIYFPKDMTAEDYNTGTITATHDDATVTGSGTTFTSSMVGQWFKAPDGMWYKILTYSSATSLELESAYQGTTTAGASYIIGDSPDLPIETHQWIPWAAAAAFYAGPRRDPAHAQTLMNMFWTGDFNNSDRRLSSAAAGINSIIRNYQSRGRANSQLVRRNKIQGPVWDERWTTTLS